MSEFGDCENTTPEDEPQLKNVQMLQKSSIFKNTYHVCHVTRQRLARTCRVWGEYKTLQSCIVSRYTFFSNHNIYKSSCGLCVCALHPLICRLYSNLLNKGLEAKKSPHEIL